MKCGRVMRQVSQGDPGWVQPMKSARWEWTLLLAAYVCAGCVSTVQPEPSPSANSLPNAHVIETLHFPSPLVISVLPFEDRTKKSELAWMSKGVPDLLVAALAGNPALTVVHRTRTEEVVREQIFQLSGQVEEESAVKVGRLVGATLLVTGSVSVIGTQTRIDGQLIGIERGTVLATAEAEGPLTDLSTVAKQFVAKVLQTMKMPSVSVRAALPEGFSTAAQANQRGETFSREGRMYQALEEFERALASDRTHLGAKLNYDATVQTLRGGELVRAGGVGGDQVIDRLVTRLVRGITMTAGTLHREANGPGGVTLTLPVKLFLSQAAVEGVVSAVRALHGQVEERPNNGAAFVLTLSDSDSRNREFVRRLTVPRRVYVRLSDRVGRTVAVYSGWQAWRWSTWVTPVDEQRVWIGSGTVVEDAVTVQGLPESVAAEVDHVTLTLEETPREQALVRVEVVDQADARARRKANAGAMGQTDAEQKRKAAVLAELEKTLRDAEGRLQASWNPPVQERTWGGGYRPSNERTTVVLASFPSGEGLHVPTLRVVRPSGDPAFDRASTAAVDAALRSPSAHHAGEGSTLTDLLATLSGLTEAGRAPAEPLILRVQFQLVRTIPALNLIGPQGGLSVRAPLNEP